ncbi:DNA replication regulator SLD2 [Polyplosphaeria fusca]|uniref:DNA replication regulator SLD2 n=1 Tax=Polyplosphaeria fusca TaxID=682080 RepID=A0A9P4R5S5_9PLEO|nr:DNA replication regulator SLD2 [Polyplosphaeria fusca]
MDTNELEQRSAILRQDLKVWEKQFASEHRGRKAGRDDIKSNATISQKYKEYNKIRDILLGKSAIRTPSKRTKSRKIREPERTVNTRPADTNNTPQKRKREEDSLPIDSAVELLSPQGPAMIGPTPQRNGIVIGLFDLLPVETPSKKRTILSEVSTNIFQTPSKCGGKTESETSYVSAVRREKTPQSSGKRFMLDRFVTPKKRKLDDQGTPTSALKGLSTPAFLRRNNGLADIYEENEPTPRPAPWKRRSFGRSLSGMIQSMKQDQEDRLDEEANIMRELEMEADGFAPLPKKAKTSKTFVKDSQDNGSLDADGFVAYDVEGEESEIDDASKPGGKIFKKRGQKRQTRRVIMRPTITKPKPLEALRIEEDSEEENVPTATPNRTTKLASDQEESEDEEYTSDDSHTPKKRKTVQPKAIGAGQEATKDGPVRTAARKVKATAHANYRRLKIKSKGNGGKGRFGRRK